MNPIFGIIITLSLLIGLFLACPLIAKRLNLNAEIARKSVHVGMGIITAMFPLFFTSAWPVWILTTIAVSTLLFIRLNKKLKTTIGSSLHGVERFSLGEFYFPIAICIIWTVSYDNPIFYIIPVLVLSLADASAAIIGSHYGNLKFTTKEGHKSWEGSIFFFIITFFCVHIPLLMYTEIGRAECLFTSILIGIIVMMFEAFSWKGLDNLVIPLLVYLLLTIYIEMNQHQILIRIIVIIIVYISIRALRGLTTLDDSSIMAATITVYIPFALISWEWSLAPLSTLFLYNSIFPSKTKGSLRQHTITSLLLVISPCSIWFIFGLISTSNHLLFLYHISFAIQLACIGISNLLYLNYNENVKNDFLKCIVFTGAIFTLISLATMPIAFWTLIQLWFTITLSVYIFVIINPKLKEEPMTDERWIKQTIICLLSTNILSLFVL